MTIMKRNILPLLICAALVLTLLPAPAQAAAGDEIYVNATTGSDLNDGSGPDQALATLNEAVVRVNAGGTIYVADGTYTGGNNRGIAIDKNISIIGQSQAGTVIDAEDSSRIFTINLGVTGTLQNLTLRNGHTIDNGGAIYNMGTLALEGCTFTGNATQSLLGGGGAIYNIGTLTATGCDFTGNTVQSLFGSGGAIYNTGTLTATGCDFIGNTVTNGCAIYHDGLSAVINFSRIVGNTGYDIYAASGTVDAQNNWWGSNDAPSFGSRVSGNVSCLTWMMLRVNVNPDSISVGGTSTVTADLTWNTINGFTPNIQPQGGHVPDGTAVSFGVQPGPGSIYPASAALVNGTATSAFTAPAAGTASVQTTVDNQTLTANITITASATAPSITTASLPGGTVATAYSQTLEATGDAPITWTIDSGSLPIGLTLSSDGVISGTPMVGTFNFTVKAENTAGYDTQALSIVISPVPPIGTAPTITTTSLPGGAMGTPYSQTLEATGDAPITWSIASGNLPIGLTLSSDGVISGPPTADGTFHFTVKAENTAGSDTKVLTIEISPAPTAPTITTASLPGGTVGTAYSQTLEATGDAPITWSIASGNLPTGLSLSGNIISGTPTAVATFNFTVKAENTAGSDTQALSIVTSPAAVASAVISPDTGSFDIYSPGNVTTAITWNSATTVTAVTDGVASLASPDHYEVTGSGGTTTLTIKQAYLATQAAGSVVLTISFDQGYPATLTITITNTTPPFVSPASVSYNLSAPGDVSTNIIWNSAQTVTGVVYNAANLAFGTDYTVAADTLIILDSYLSGLAPAEGAALVFEINFNTGDTATLTVNVGDSYTPSDDADLSDLQVGGATVSGFDPDITSYNVELPYSTSPGSAAALVGATASDPRAQVGITQASALPGSATVTVTAEDTTTKTYTIHFTLGAAPGTAPTITTTSLPNGRLGSSYSQTLAATGDTPITWTIDSGSLPDGLSLSSGGVISGTPTARGAFNFTVKAENSAGDDTQAFSIVINAASTGGGGGGSGTPATPTPATPTPTYTALVSGISAGETNLLITVNTDAGNAMVTPGALTGDIFTGNNNTVISIPSIPGVNSYTLGLPADSLSGSDGESTLTLSTDAGSITIPDNMLAGLPEAAGKEIGITIGEGDKSGLTDDVRAAIGDRPLVQLTLTLDGEQTAWNNPAAPVTVTIPYTPTAEELLSPESIVIWYIDGSGNVVSVPNGRYDPATGTVTFTTSHFSYYAVGYNKVRFNDVASSAWYNKAVGFIAARGIATGTGGGNYSPDAKLTRGQFIVLLMRAYGIAPDENPEDNFADAGNTWYTNYLAAAKRLGISAGAGNNMFVPEKEITRQEMFTLLYNALKRIGGLPQGSSGKTLSDFADAGDIASWAREAMTLPVETGTIRGYDGKLFPTDTTTRAEIAQVLYNLLSK